MDLGCSQDRLQGFIDAMDEADFVIDKSLIGSGSFTRASGELLAKSGLSQKENQRLSLLPMMKWLLALWMLLRVLV